jgi:hypothetical protein
MMRTTIRHDVTGRAIVAYLAAAGAVRQYRHIARYMQLMHATSHNCTMVTLRTLARRGAVEKVRRGWYRTP